MAGFFKILFLLLALSISVPLVLGKKKQPNIVFILCDDLGWSDVSFHGYGEMQTPNIDRLAHEGVILNSMYAQYVCTPSRVALMTAKYPFRLGLQSGVLGLGERRGLSLKEKLMPEYMKDLGYRTHMIGKWHLGYHRPAYTPTRRGFDSFFGFHMGSIDYFNYTATLGTNYEHFGFDLFENTTPQWQYLGRYATKLFTEKAEDIIENHEADKPLFLYLSHAAPHWANAYEPVQAPQEDIDRFSHIQDIGRRKYAATMASLDDSVGRVHAALERKGILDNTIIVFQSDNGGTGPPGEYFSPQPTTYGNNWPLRGEKVSQWEGGVRTTTFVWSPLLKQKGYVSYELYHIIDWLPTFFELGGGDTAELPSNLDGLNIWNSISQRKPSPRKDVVIQLDPTPRIQEYAYRWKQYKIIIGTAISNGTRLDSWDLPVGFNTSYIHDDTGAIFCDGSNRIPCDANVAPCLFDVVADPCEYVNLAASKTVVLARMMDKLKAYNDTAVYPQARQPPDPLSKTVYTNGTLSPWLSDE